MKRSMKIAVALCLLGSLHINLAMDQKEQITAEKSINPDLKAFIALKKNGARGIHPSALEYLRTMVIIQQEDSRQPSDCYPRISDITRMLPREPRVIIKQGAEPVPSISAAMLPQNANRLARCTSVSNCYNPLDRIVAKPAMGPIEPRAEAFLQQQRKVQITPHQAVHIIAALASTTMVCESKAAKQ